MGIVMRWRLILEEFSPKLINNKGHKKIVSDALSGLDKIDNLKNKNEPTFYNIKEEFSLNNMEVLNSTSFKTIMRFQHKDKSLIEIADEKL